LLEHTANLDRSEPPGATAATDTAIDHLVYELYDLTPEEIALVEAGAASEYTQPYNEQTLILP
jgi:hypothetical protein